MDTRQGAGDGLRRPADGGPPGLPWLATQRLAGAVDQLPRLLPPLGRVGAVTGGLGQLVWAQRRARQQRLLSRLRTIRQS